MKFLKPKPKPCPDTLFSMRYAGKSDWPCELPAGHEGPHERTTRPVTGTWTTEHFANGGWAQHITSLSMHD